MLDSGHRSVGRRTDLVDVSGYLLGGASGLIGKLLHLAGDNGKPFAGFTGTCCLDRRVQGEQVRLCGYLADHVGNSADTGNLVGEDADLFTCAAAGLYRAGDDDGGLIDLAADSADGGGEPPGRTFHDACIGEGLLRSARCTGDGGTGALSRRRHPFGRLCHAKGEAAHLVERSRRLRLDRVGHGGKCGCFANSARSCSRVCSAVSCSFRCMACLNTTTASAIPPTSSRRSVPGTLTDRSPSASFAMVSFSAASEFAISRSTSQEPRKVAMRIAAPISARFSSEALKEASMSSVQEPVIRSTCHG